MKTLIVETAEGICQVTLHRPEKLNALNNCCMQELKEVFENVASSESIRAVILTGSGEKSFVAGADIKELAELTQKTAEADSRLGQLIFAAIENCGKPVIAAVNGFALGGGCELALAASFRLASDNARFSLPEVTLGLIPGYGGTQRLSALIGSGRAAEMMLTGNMIDAEKACAWGLVNEVLPQDQLLPRAHKLAEKISRNAPLAVSYALKALNTGVLKGLEKGFEHEAKLFGDCFETEDYHEGTKAFLEKRKAVFKGK